MSGIAQLNAAQAAKEQYEIKAGNELIKGRPDALNYQRVAINLLRELNAAMASTAANAFACGVDTQAEGTIKMTYSTDVT